MRPPARRLRSGRAAAPLGDGTTRLILVRHGQTDWNLAGRFQGQADPPLNAVGRQQAEALAESLAAGSVAAIYSSDLQRAFDTADIVARRLGLTVQVDPRLREVNQGLWEGMLLADILTRYPDEWAARERDPLRARPPGPGGESIVDVAARTWPAADDIARAHAAGPVLIVSHGLSLATLLCRALDRPLVEARQHIPENAVPILIDWAANGAHR
jgi:broad specificity phosphatase PhoE